MFYADESIFERNKKGEIKEIKDGIPKSHEDYQSVLDPEYISMSSLTGALVVFVIIVLLFAFVTKIHRLRRKYESSSK